MDCVRLPPFSTVENGARQLALPARGLEPVSAGS
jgi:hypothetical protein